MSVTYERSGGLAGLQDVLKVDGSKGLALSRRGKVASQRPLSAEEARRLKELLDRARAAPVPAEPKGGHRISDAFTMSVTLEGEPGLRLRRVGASAPEGGGDPWLELHAWLDRLLSDEIQRAP